MEKDGKKYLVSEFEPGKTAPIFHVNCRGTIEPDLDEESENLIVNNFTNSTPDVYNEYIENRINDSDGDYLEIKRKYAVKIPDLAEVMFFVTPVDYGDYDTEDNLNNPEYKAAYERYLKMAESRGVETVNMNVFLNTTLPVLTKIKRNREAAYSDFFDGIKKDEKIFKNFSDDLGNPLGLSEKDAADGFLDILILTTDTLEKVFIDDALDEDISIDDYEDELTDFAGKVIDLTLGFVGKRKASSVSVSRNLYSSAGKKALNKGKRKAVEAGKRILKNQAEDIIQEILERNNKKKQTELSDSRGKIITDKDKLREVCNLGLNYELSEKRFKEHILIEHSFDSKLKEKSYFNKDFDIKGGIDDTLKGNDSVVRYNTSNRKGYIFEKTFDKPIGVSSNSNPCYILKVVINENGNVLTAYPTK